MDSTEDEPTMFVLEDDQELLADIKRLALCEGWKLEPARCLEQAKAKAESLGSRMSLALIDLMVPKNEEDLTKADALIKERESLIMNWTAGGKKTDFSLEELKRYRQELGIKDQAIAALIELDGGLSFLEYAQSKGFAKDWVVVVFSARDRDEDNLEDRAAKTISDARCFRWLQKPVSPFDLVELLRQLKEERSPR